MAITNEPPISAWWSVIPPPQNWNTIGPIPGTWIHPVYPRCNCPHCKRVRGELPAESAYIPALRPEDV